MVNCSFCDSPIMKGSGVMFVKKDGSVFYFCSSKCKKNSLGMKREGRRQKWTPAARKFMEMQKKKSKK
ncbi:50S ribosomal protein L24e [Candidatus Micrarchaeota archaeon]|nr:50S ribosomal protein L24e [Candidatus Micrarchaeota archaeon]